MLPLLSKLSLEPTDAPVKRKAPDGSWLSAEDALAYWVSVGFVSVRPRKPQGGHTLQFFLHLTGTARTLTAPDDEEPDLDELREIESALVTGPMNVQRGEGQTLYTTKPLPASVRQAIEARREIVTKRLITWMRGTDDLNAFGVFRDEDHELWRLEAFHTALSSNNRGELLELLEDVLGFVFQPSDDPGRTNEYGHDRLWIRKDERNGLLPDGVLQAFEHREARFRVASEQAKAAEEKLAQEAWLRSIFADDAAAAEQVRREREEAHTKKVQAELRGREMMYEKADTHGLSAVPDEDVEWHDKTFPTPFASYFKKRKRREFVARINTLRSTARLPVMETPADVALQSWEAAAVASAILATISNMCDSLVAAYESRGKHPARDAGQITVSIRLNRMPLPLLRGGGAKLFVRTQPSAASSNRHAGRLDAVAWTVYVGDDAVAAANAALRAHPYYLDYDETQKTVPITNLRTLFIALNALVRPAGDGTPPAIEPTIHGWTTTDVDAAPRYKRPAPTLPRPPVDEDGFRPRRRDLQP